MEWWPACTQSLHGQIHRKFLTWGFHIFLRLPLSHQSLMNLICDLVCGFYWFLAVLGHCVTVNSGCKDMGIQALLCFSSLLGWAGVPQPGKEWVNPNGNMAGLRDDSSCSTFYSTLRTIHGSMFIGGWGWGGDLGESGAIQKNTSSGVHPSVVKCEEGSGAHWVPLSRQF